MSGAGEGKVELKGVKVFVHVKGKSRARITHIDVEAPGINKIIKPGESTYCGGKEGGIFIGLKKAMIKRAENLALK